MKYNKEKLTQLIQSDSKESLEKNKERIRNRASIRESKKLALKILKRLDELKWTKAKLAKEMGYNYPQQVTKLVSGKENHTQETLIKIYEVLGIPTLASHVQAENKVHSDTNTFSASLKTRTQTTSIVAMEYNPVVDEYTFHKAS